MPEEKIISELITEYGDSILRMCYVYLKDYHLAEDVTRMSPRKLLFKYIIDKLPEKYYTYKK